MMDTEQEAFANALRNKNKNSTLDELKKLASKIKNINAFYIDRDAEMNLFFKASMEDSIDGVKALLENEGDPSLANNVGTNCLFLMMKRGQTKMAQLCLDSLDTEDKKKAFLNATKKRNGFTPLMETVFEGNKLSSLKWLLETKLVDLHLSNSKWTPLHAAAKNFQAKTDSPINRDFVTLLVNAGADVDRKADHRDFGYGVTPADVVHKNHGEKFDDLFKKK